MRYWMCLAYGVRFTRSVLQKRYRADPLGDFLRDLRRPATGAFLDQEDERKKGTLVAGAAERYGQVYGRGVSGMCRAMDA